MRTITESDLRVEHAAINAILLDLDGVLTNFVGSAAKLHGREERSLLASWPPGVWDMAVVLDMSVKDFVGPIVTAGECFWRNMELYHYADQLFDMCQRFAPTFICTTPFNNPPSVSGKLEFLHRWRGRRFNDYVFSPHKALLARPDQVLIDDSDKNVNAFRARHGKAILFPQIFNSNYPIAHESLAYVERELKTFCGE